MSEHQDRDGWHVHLTDKPSIEHIVLKVPACEGCKTLETRVAALEALVKRRPVSY